MIKAFLVTALAAVSVYADLPYPTQGVNTYTGYVGQAQPVVGYTAQIRSDTPYNAPQANTYSNQYNGQPVYTASYPGLQSRTDMTYNQPAQATYTNAYSAPQSAEYAVNNAPEVRSDVPYTNSQQGAYMPYAAPEMRSDTANNQPQFQTYSAQSQPQMQYSGEAQLRSFDAPDANDMANNAPNAPNVQFLPSEGERAMSGKCCPTELNYCGSYLAQQMIRENCGGFVPKEGMLYSCKNFQPQELLSCKQCLITGNSLNDVCVPEDSWNKKVISIAGWLRIGNSSELRCCSEDVKYCGSVLFSEVDSHLCKVPINQDAFYGCRDGQPYELAPSCEQCITTGEGTNDICVNGADRFKMEFDITPLILAPENQKKPDLVPGVPQVGAQ